MFGKSFKNCLNFKKLKVSNVDDLVVVLVRALGLLREGLAHAGLGLFEVGRGAQDRRRVGHVSLGDQIIHAVTQLLAQHGHGEDHDTRAAAGTDQAIQTVDELAQVVHLIDMSKTEDTTIHRYAVSHSDAREIRAQRLGGVTVLKAEADVRVAGHATILTDLEQLLETGPGNHILSKNVSERHRARGRLNLSGHAQIVDRGLGVASSEGLRRGHRKTRSRNLFV